MTLNDKYDVGQMLTDIHLENYRLLFQTLGYRTASDCANLNNAKLQEMGIQLTGHRKRILKKIQEVLEKKHGISETATVETEGMLTSRGSKDDTTNNSVSMEPKHNNQDLLSNQQALNSDDDALLDLGEHIELGTKDFFKFQGPMVDNDLYEIMHNDPSRKTQTKKVPSRSFILRNRPVPELPVSVNDSSYNRNLGEITTYTTGNVHHPLQNKQSGDENINPISPYEETFFFQNSDSTKETDNDKSPCLSNSDIECDESVHASVCQSSPHAMLLTVDCGSDESVYSTLEECSHAEVPLSESSNITSQSDTISSQEEFAIAPYASFYSSCAMPSKSGWLDKLSPHSTCMFQKRWVKFDGQYVSYYFSDRDVFSRGRILLSAIIKIHKQGENKFGLVTSLRTFVFRAEREGPRQEWINTLQQGKDKHTNKNTLPSYGDKRGYLELRGYKNNIYAVIDGSKLWLSKHKQEYKAGIAITDIELAMATLKTTDRKGFEIITPFRNFCFTAESEREKQDWIETLEQSIAEAVADYEVAEKIWFNESNRSCADCRAPNPDWASINLGVVICRSCAGQHKALGRKMSKVYSLKLDMSIWSNELVELFVVLGNEKINSFWEADLQPENKICATSSINQRRLFVMQKYKEGRFKKKRFPSLSTQQLNEALCAAVTQNDVLETMMLVFSGADVMCTTGDPIFNTPYHLAKMAGQHLQMEFLYRNRFSDYQPTASLAKSGTNQNGFYCGILYKAPSSSKMSNYRKLNEELTRCWCTLEDGLLSFYEDENNSMPDGCIDLNEAVCLVVHPLDFSQGLRAFCTFEIYLLSERIFLFGAENEESQKEWAKAISKNFVTAAVKSLTELQFEVIGFLYYKDPYTLMEWKKGWFALEKACLHYSHRQEDLQHNTIQLKKLQELSISTSFENGSKINVLLLIEDRRTLHIHGHTVLDFMAWHCAIEKAAGTDGNALQDQQLCKNNIPIIVNSCMAFVTQYGLGSKSLYLKSGNPLKVRGLLEDFQKNARSVKLKVGKHQLEDVTDVLKHFLYETDDALLTKELYPYWISALDIGDEGQRVLKYKNLIDTLPALNKVTLAALIEHLFRIQKCSDVNHLDIHILAQIFSSCLFQTEGQHEKEVCIVEDLIKFYTDIFDVSEVQLQQMDIENRFITKWNYAQVPIPQCGDLLLEVYLERKDPEMCVIIRVSPTMVVEELTRCVSGIKNITLSKEMFWTTFEVFEDGELERPMHYKEKVLETVLRWSMLPDPGSAYLLVKPFNTFQHLMIFDKNLSKHIHSGNMKYKEDTAKLLSGNKFQERYFVLREKQLLIYKCIKSFKPDKVLPVAACKFFIGVKKKIKPPTRFGITVNFEKHQWHLCCDTQEAQMEWIINIFNAQHSGDLFPKRKTEQTLTMTTLRMPEFGGLKDTPEFQHLSMSEKTGIKMRPALSKERLISTIQQRISVMGEILDCKEEERLTKQKKHYSLVDLDSPKNYGGNTRELYTIDVKRQHHATDQLNKELSANIQLPQNVIKELNAVLRKSKT